jgi:biotin carboxylase
MKKALIHIGAGPLQRETLLSARAAGLHVVATDARPDAANAGLADDFHVIRGDDAEGLVRLAHELSNDFEVAGAYAGSDFGLVPVARIHETLGLPGCAVENVLLALDKYRSKQAFLCHGVETPQGWVIEDTSAAASLEQCRLPLIVKPVDSCGSQGVTSVERPDQLQPALAKAFEYGKKVVVEEFFCGTGVDTIGIVWNGRFIPCGIGTRIFSEKPYHFPICGHTPPALSQAEIEYAYDLTGRAALALGINFSPVKADLLYNQGAFTVLEVTPRFHGDVFSSMLIPFSGGTAPARLLFDLMANAPSPQQVPAVGSRLVLWRALFPLTGSVDFEMVQQRLSGRWELLSFYYDMARLKKISGHRDNTSLVGFFWVALASLDEVAAFNAHFHEQFGKELL